MPGNTIIEKIFQSHSTRKASAGQTIWIDIDVASARDFGGPNVVKNLQKYYEKDTSPFDYEKVFFTFDLVAPANNKKYADNQQICREFAKRNHIKVYDVDMGIGSHVLFEQGKILPNTTAVGTDSHYNILGAFGAFGQGMGDVDIAYIFKKGRT